MALVFEVMMVANVELLHEKVMKDVLARASTRQWTTLLAAVSLVRGSFTALTSRPGGRGCLSPTRPHSVTSGPRVVVAEATRRWGPRAG